MKVAILKSTYTKREYMNTILIIIAVFVIGSILLAILAPLLKLLVMVAIGVVLWRVIKGEPWNGKGSKPKELSGSEVHGSFKAHEPKQSNSVEVRGPDQL